MGPAGASYILTAAQFERDITQHGGDIAWRRAQVDRVLASFEESKGYMSRDGIGEVRKYLTGAKWVQHCTNVGQHPAYKRFVGTDGHGVKSLYYFHFFIIQAVFVQNGRETDSDKERRLIMGNIQGAHVPSERQSTSDNKHKELSVHLEAAAKISAEIQNEDEIQQQRSMDLQRMRHEIRHLQQRNLDLQRALQQETQNRRNAKRNQQALQNRLEQGIEQLQDAQTQLQETNHKLIESRQHAKGLQEQLGRVQAYITHHQQFSMQIAELEKQHEALSAKRQQCINIIAKQTPSRVDGSKSPTKRAADGSADGEGSKRPRQE
ncbi:hypothetical protein FDENT_2327 [Fusarium denticulatum]|uniref:REM-1 domain-containing protein n=1 Tax=Fusarium denticulatum TaxID=48507 RepID=A0A8H5XG36_9HYPO|nr:hypothetical protein FDENT_2327 [Fusarium denticulatum]